MRAMLLEKPSSTLKLIALPVPEPTKNQILIRVLTCGVCRTDLHVVDGELPNINLPVIPGHEVIGEIVSIGSQVDNFRIGDHVGVPWLGHTCRICTYCRSGKENLCDSAQFTGYTLNGGYADFMIVESDFCFKLSKKLDPVKSAPFLCAGLIGYRSLRMTGKSENIGLYGFGAAAHIISQVATYQGREVFTFTRPGDHAAQKLALELGAVWAGDSNHNPPEKLDAALIFAPVGELVPRALQQVKKGGTVVCAGIHMSDIPSFPYAWLWGERKILSVANLTRQDEDGFFNLISKIAIKTEIKTYDLEDANQALDDLRYGRLSGAAVLRIRHESSS